MRVDPESISTRQEFAAALTAVREDMGLTVREVARAAGIKPSTAGGYFSGRHLPPLRPDGGIRAVLTACGLTDPAELDAWQRTLARVRRAPGPRPGALPPPHPGLAAYRTEDAARFFGRDAETRELTAALTAAADPSTPPGTARLAVLLGPAGSGKTSLVQAGVAPRLTAGGHEVTVRTAGHLPPGELVPAGPGRRVLVVDQLERLGEADRDATVRRLARLTRRADGPAVLAVLRTEAAAAFTRHPAVASAVRAPVLTLDTPDEGQLRSIVVEPARRAGIDVDPELVDAVLTDARILADRGIAPLPPVSHALLATWRQGRRGALTLAAYREVGGALGAVSVALEGMPGTGESLARPRSAVPAHPRARAALAALRRGWPARSWGSSASPDER